MSQPYVSLAVFDGEAVIAVQAATTRRFPLTRPGCVEAGKHLHDIGAEDWLCSSDVDFPSAVKPGCKIDVRAALDYGWQEACDDNDRPRRSLIAKLLAHASQPAFMATLTDAEASELRQMQERHDAGDI